MADSAQVINVREETARSLDEGDNFSGGLQPSTVFYSALVENSTDVIVVIDQEGRIRYSSPTFEHRLKHDRTAALGTSVFSYLHPDDQPIARRLFEGILHFEHWDVPVELRVRQADGHYLYFETKSTNLIDEPSVRGIVVNAREIEDRKQAELVQQSILRISEAAHRTQNLEELFKEMHAVISDLMPANNFYLALYDDQSELLWFPYFIDEYDEPPPPQKLGRGLTEYVLRTGQPLLASPETFAEMVQRGEVEEIGPSSIDWLGVPMYIDGRPLGALVVQSYTQNVRFADRDKTILTFVSEQAALSIARKQAEEAMRESETRYRGLFENSPISLWEEDFSEVRRYLEGLKASGTRDIRLYFSTHPDQLVECMSMLRVIDVNQATLRLFGARSKEELLKNLPQVLGSETLPVILEELVAIAEDRHNFEGFGVNYRLDGTVAEIAIRWTVFPKYEQTWSRVIVSILDITDRKEAEARAQAQLHRLNALRSIDASITGSLDLHATLNVVLEQVRTQLEVDAATVLLLNPLELTLTYAADFGFRTPALKHTRLRLGQGYAGQSALDRRKISVPNLLATPDGLEKSPRLAEEQFIHYIATPLIAKGQVKGVLEIFHRSPLDPTEEWIDFLDTLARQAAIAIDNATLFTDLQRSNLELSLAYDATIEGWSRALDLRDKETEGHTQRVTDMTLKLARMMGTPASAMMHLRWGALLHDIGKMGIPDSILLKPGPLTRAEWIIMRRHPIYASEMLAPISYLRQAIDIPLHHHERWDGKGYPSHLSREKIPLGARIFAVVDVWDALRSDRPYRPAWDEDRALQYIVRQRSRHFDPQVVDAFMVLRTSL